LHIEPHLQFETDLLIGMKRMKAMIGLHLVESISQQNQRNMNFRAVLLSHEQGWSGKAGCNEGQSDAAVVKTVIRQK